jgi:hypothetical protein
MNPVRPCSGPSLLIRRLLNRYDVGAGGSSRRLLDLRLARLLGVIAGRLGSFVVTDSLEPGLFPCYRNIGPSDWLPLSSPAYALTRLETAGMSCPSHLSLSSLCPLFIIKKESSPNRNQITISFPWTDSSCAHLGTPSKAKAFDC